ncbi:tetratricopeptide repeat protein [Phyllobacterium myrsinacearum]|uniref:Tetratricopeptide (TPR) repeat protein n=1 Tax=Phyllobacterium myrsinacearum TaxID=28101 RepID=A0A839EPP9_9HYPH|nr:tetratricopeptide repeat protein [Phyllobacterium myrsinacearum]MBA8880859.1 tetratricopeptide (TPR) repeat protein [Phyllobacterium myrsinacearum]
MNRLPLSLAFVVMISCPALALDNVTLQKIEHGCIDETASSSPEERISNCTNWIDNAPNDARAKAYYDRGNAYLDAQKLDLAVADYSHAISLKPDFKEAYYSRGYTRHDLGDYDHAIEDYDTVLKLVPDDVDSLYGKAYAYQKKGDLDAAIAGYTSVIHLKPDYPTAYYNRAIAYNAKGDTENATRDALEYERQKSKTP